MDSEASMDQLHEMTEYQESQELQDENSSDSSGEERDDGLNDLTPAAKQILMKLVAESKNKDRPVLQPINSSASANEPVGKKRGRKSAKSKKWAHEEILKLIELYEAMPCLWDVSHKSYHLRDIREKALDEMATEQETTVKEIKSKLLNLRSQLGQENMKVKKIKSGQATDELYKPNWTYWQHLQFLQPAMQPVRSRDNLQKSAD